MKRKTNFLFFVVYDKIIKVIRMSNKGFTLAEVLAVVIILALFGLIGIVSVESIIKKGTEKAYSAQMNEIKLAAENLIKIEGEPTWCENEQICFISLRYLVYNKQIKLNEEGEYINPKTDKPFSLEIVVLVRKYGSNYILETYDSYDSLAEVYPNYITRAKQDALKASATIYNQKGLCSNNLSCTIRTSDLVNNNLLESNFYNDVNITINSNNQINIG